MRIIPISSLYTLRGVNFIITRSDGKILVQKRSQDALTYPGRYCIPGGAIDPGETALEAVRREIWEETGIVSPALSPLCDVLYTRGVVGVDVVEAINRVFTARVPMGTKVLSLEGEMYWSTIEEAKELNLAVGAEVLLVLIEENAITMTVPA